jgi:hypothetical protein
MIRISQNFIVEVSHIQFQQSLQWFYGIYRKPLLGPYTKQALLQIHMAENLELTNNF